MPKCTKCGKKGFFLKLENGLCFECLKIQKEEQKRKMEKFKAEAIKREAEAEAERKKRIAEAEQKRRQAEEAVICSNTEPVQHLEKKQNMKGVFEIRVDGAHVEFVSRFDKYNAPAILSPDEQQAFDVIKNILNKNDIVFDDLKAVRRSDDYVTFLLNKNNDFFRFHFGIYSKWLSISVSSKKFIDDERFENVKNKNTRHWKVKINNISDIRKYEDVIIHELNYVPKSAANRNPVPCNDNEKMFLDKLTSLISKDLQHLFEARRLSDNSVALTFKNISVGNFKLYGKTISVYYFDAKKGWNRLKGISLQECIQKTSDIHDYIIYINENY